MSEGEMDIIVNSQPLTHRFTDVRNWYAPNFSLWKRPLAWPFLRQNGQKIIWKSIDKSVDATTVVWGGLTQIESGDSVPVRMEDGFIHSLGLGSDLSPPYSQVMDRVGIYFDTKNNNELFNLLNSYNFEECLLSRASRLRQLIVEAGVTKYNLGRKRPVWQRNLSQQVILVVGQVADDASVKLGTTEAMSSVDALLKLVWSENPYKLIVYKPHPDVLSGNRKGLAASNNYCHVVDAESDIISLIESVDEVHTLSSLAGFDALLRGKKVVTYGLPFYSGWGLTEDRVMEIPHRKRKVSIDALVAATLILYPIYWDWETKEFSTPEAIVKKLAPFVNRPLRATPSYKRLLIKTYRWSKNLAIYMFLQYQQMNQK